MKITTSKAIIVGGLIIGIAIMITAPGGGSRTSDHGQDEETTFRFTARLAEAAELSPDDTPHLRGNTDAPVRIIEFSDFECPFCARLHPTIAQIVNDRPNEVNWEYRHLPLSIHRNAQSSALASECVASLGGNDTFWEFTDRLFVSQKKLDDRLYQSLATELGIEQNSFQACIEGGDLQKKVSEDSNQATRLGGRGTPFWLVVAPNGTAASFSGALPYTDINRIVDVALTQTE